MVDYPPKNPLQLEANLANRVTAAKEAVWFRIGVLQSTMLDREKALNAFERVLAVNPNNVRAMTQAGAVLAKKECYNEAVAYLQRAISTDPSCGEAWAVLAHCYVMTDELQKAYQAYQSALGNLPNPRDPNLWYGIGLLYDRYGSLDNALEAFLAVLSITPDFERADEVCFCIGIIYKEQQRFDDALKYFNRVVVAANPPPPLTRADGWYQIGHVHELKRDISAAMDMYKQALTENPEHTKTLQNMGWLEHNHYQDSAKAVQYLRQSADLDPSDGQTWYLLGRVYMAMREFRQAYDAYQQAVYRDSRNATFWCSIGVLYYQMNQCRDAMDAYIRAIRLNPYVSEVWYDLGTLYESCNQKIDAIDAYREAAKLAPDNVQIAAQLRELENNMAKAQHHPGPSQQTPATQTHHVQMQPEMNSGAQPRMTHLPNRTIPPIDQMRSTATAPPHTLPQHQPTEQPPQRHSRRMLSHHPVLDPSHPQSAVHPMHQRAAPPEMAPIPSIRPPPMTAMPGAPAPAPSAFAQPARPPLSAPIPSAQPSSQQMAPIHQPRLSQQLPQHQQPQPSVTLAPPPSMTQQQHVGMPMPMPMPMQPSASMPDAKLKPLSRPSLPHDPQLQHYRPIQQSHLQLPRLASSSPAGTEIQQAQPLHTSRPPDHSPQHLPPREPQPLSHPQLAHTTRPAEQQQQQQQPLPTVQTQQTSHLPSLQPLPQMQPLPHMQQGSSPSSESRQRSADAAVPGQAEHARPGAAVDSADSDANEKGHKSSQFARDERVQDRHEASDEAKMPKATQPHAKMVDKMDTHSEENSRPALVFSPGQERDPRGSDGREKVPGRQESLGDDASAGAGPTSRRRVSDNESNSVEPSRETRQHADTSRSSRERDQLSGRPSDSQTHNGHSEREKSRTPDRLPPMKQMSDSAGNNKIDTTRDNATTKIPPSLPLPSSNANSLPPLSEVDTGQHAPQSSVGGLASTAGNATIGTRTHSLPHLSSRSPAAIGGDSNIPTSSSIGLASSLTKFSKGIVHAPTTPVNNTTAPSSLPSPLPARKNTSGGTGLHTHRSPRVSKPTSIPSFKPIPIPPPGYNGQMDSVPSPGSLPVLPALSSRANHDDQMKSGRDKDKHGSSREEVRRADDEDSRTHRKGSASSPHRADEDGNHPRKSEDALPIKSSLGMLRSAPAPRVENEGSDREAMHKEERRRSPSASSFERRNERMKSPSAASHGKDSSHSSKRESGARDEPGRTAKRPRLHEVNEREGSQRPYGVDGEDKPSRKLSKLSIERRNEESGKGSRIKLLKNEMPPFRDTKSDLLGSKNSQGKDAERSHRRDNMGRDDEDLGRPSRSPQVIDLPRLSNPMSKIGAPPQLPANTPLPSFRSERKNISASRSANGSGTSGKVGNQEGGRSSLFALHSTPVSLPHMRKSAGNSSARGTSERKEYGSSRGTEESVSKAVTEDNVDGTLSSKNAREEKRMERMANGESTKGKMSSSEIELRKGSELGKKEDKPSRSEIRSGAT